jgi:SP family xylose:H+ symportor-like MFS transporter
MAAHNKSLVLGLTLIATLGGLLFGYDTAVISGAVDAIDYNFIAPLTNLSADARAWVSGLTISSALAGCIIGSACGGVIGDRFGRRGGLIFAAIMFLICSIGSAWPEFGVGKIGQMGSAALLPFNIYRIIGGIGVGLASMLAPLYIAEITPPKTRGMMVTFQQIAIVGGILIAYFVNALIAHRGDWGLIANGLVHLSSIPKPDADFMNHTAWRWMFAAEAIPALLLLVLMIPVPDTPRWLVLKGRDEAANQVLARIAEPAEAKLVLKEIEDSLVVKTEPLLTYGALVIGVGLLLSIFQQFVGINAVLYYAPTMFKNMGGSDDPLILTVITGIANVVFTLVATFTVDRLGRKPLLIAGALVMAVAMILLGSLFYNHNMGAASVGAVILYIAGFAFSWGPIVWVMLAEIFPNSIKGKAMALAVAAQWVANLVVSTTFKVLNENAYLTTHFNHGFAYFLYGACSVLAAVFVWKYVPETKGKSLEEMQHLWGRRTPAASRAA